MKLVRNPMPHIYPWLNESIHIINKFQDFSVHSDWGKRLSATQICCSSNRISWMTFYLGQITTSEQILFPMAHEVLTILTLTHFCSPPVPLTQRPQPQKWSFCFITSFEVLAFIVSLFKRLPLQPYMPGLFLSWGTGQFLCKCLGVYTCVGRYVCLGVHALWEFRDHCQAFSSMTLHFCCSFFFFPSLVLGNFWLT